MLSDRLANIAEVNNVKLVFESNEYAEFAVEAGAIVVDNSSAFRSDEDVPLVVPEINAVDVATHKGIIANPNCSTIVTVMALYPLHLAFGVKRIFASTYQAVSGSGAIYQIGFPFFMKF